MSLNTPEPSAHLILEGRLSGLDLKLNKKNSVLPKFRKATCAHLAKNPMTELPP